jgi:hypothetical protein
MAASPPLMTGKLLSFKVQLEPRYQGRGFTLGLFVFPLLFYSGVLAVKKTSSFRFG